MPPLVVQGHAMTDTGRVRPHNEDCVYLDERLRYAVLADGMGGANAGEVASALAVDCFRAALEELSDADFTSRKTVLDTLHHAIEDAHAQILDQARENPACAGMGATVVAAAIVNQHLLFVHAGDSRLYRFRNGKLEQLTRDHSLVQQQFELGLIRSEERRTSPQKHIITHALGVDLGSDIAWDETELQAGDQILLCSDGLTDMLDDDGIATLLATGETSLSEKTETLVAQANANGGRDNISVVLLRISHDTGTDELSFFQRQWQKLIQKSKR